LTKFTVDYWTRTCPLDVLQLAEGPQKSTKQVATSSSLLYGTMLTGHSSESSRRAIKQY